jgi:predicted ATPase/class 3 adenylate cyclase
MADLPTGTVTFLFTDIEGSTNLARTLGARWTAVLETHNALIRAEVEDYRGLVLRTEGDAFFTVFPSAVDAAGASAAAQRSLAGHPWPVDGVIRVRMGMHTGEGVLGGDEYVGLDVHHAARVAAAGHGGQVLLSEATRALVNEALPAGVALRDLGEHRLKDFDQAQHLYQLVIDGLESDFPALRTSEAPTNLPVPLTTFVGREHELEALEALISSSRIVTLTGPGGSGKTRLATEAARRTAKRYPDGVHFVDLSPLRDADLVPSAMAAGLGLTPRPGSSPIEWVASHLAERRALLVLDNFEQVAGGAGIVSDLLDRAPQLTAVVTSRVTLGLGGERLFPVPPLALPHGRADLDTLSRNEAAALFRDRARAFLPSFELTEENAQAVADVCARLDGLPLAIELAATQLRVFSPSELVLHLERRLPLRTGAVNVPERQRTLRGTIEWSHQLLGEPEQRLFARLAVFAGGMTMDAALAVGDGGGDLGEDAVEVLASLVDQSLVRRTEASGSSRFVMLETIREFAGDRLAESPDREAVEARHRELFAGLAERWGPSVRGPSGAEAMAQLLVDQDNLRAALQSAVRAGDAGLGLQMVSNLWTFWVERGDLAEGRGIAERLLSMPGASDRDGKRAAALGGLGGLRYWLSDYRGSAEAYEEQASILSELGDRRGEARVRKDLAHVALARGDPPSAAAHVVEAQDLAAGTDDGRLLSELAVISGSVKAQTGDLEGAVADLQEGLARVEALEGRSFWASEIKARLSVIYRLMGRLDEAEQIIRATIDRSHPTLVSPVGAPAVALQMAAIAQARGDHSRALRLAAFAQAASARTGAEPPWYAMMIPRFATIRDAADGVLDPSTIDRLWAEGMAMGTDQAMEYALGGESMT